MEFEMNEEFRKKFKIKDQVIKFTSHQQLDTFILNLIEIDKHFLQKYGFVEFVRTNDDSAETMILKSFDRAFWLRHRKTPGDDTVKPYSENNIQLCPFGIPTMTNSILEFRPQPVTLKRKKIQN
jgi:hypothetical protein